MKKNIFKILLIAVIGIILISFPGVYMIGGRLKSDIIENDTIASDTAANDTAENDTAANDTTVKDTVELVYVDDLHFQSEGGILSGIYVGGKLLSIELRLFSSMFQTSEKYFISGNAIFYEKITYFYHEPMDTSSMTVSAEHYVISNGDVYQKKYDADQEQEVLMKDEQNIEIMNRYNEYKEIIEEKYGD